jgi:bifunctional non-homologous end joining protein LigD
VSPKAKAPAAKVRAGRRTIEVSSPDKVMFPDAGVTKLELAEHYARVAPAMLPHVRERPVTMHVFPAGLRRPGIYIKKAAAHFPDWIPRVTVAKRDGETSMAIVNEAAALVYLAGQNCITPHFWPARADDLSKPDRLIFDFDPPEGTDFADIRAGARATGELLREVGLVPFAMTSGSRGLHVIAPLRRDAGWDEARAFADAVGERVAEQDPEHLTTAFRIAKRGGRIYVDTTRNAYAQHGVAPYAVRAKPGAPVATPLHWEELDDPKLTAHSWDIRTIGARLEDGGDPWKGMGSSARSVRKAAAKLTAA